MRLTKIYTRQGDNGFTKLGEKKLTKDDLLIEVIGTIDELNSVIGMIIAIETDEKATTILTQIQHELFNVGAELYLPDRPKITATTVSDIEKTLDQLNENLPPLKEFILPRGTLASAICHLARTICRRAERRLVKLHLQVALNNKELLKYLNRLSDLLFVLARVLTHGQKEVLWENKK